MYFSFVILFIFDMLLTLLNKERINKKYSCIKGRIPLLFHSIFSSTMINIIYCISLKINAPMQHTKYKTELFCEKKW